MQAPSRVARGPDASGVRGLIERPGLLLCGLMLLALVLRLIGIDRIALWNDELFSRYYPETGLGFMWSTGFTMEPTPPLYYTLAAWWTGLFGTTEFGIRSFSAIASVAAIPLIYWLGRELVGNVCGVVAAVLMALAPTNIYYAQEARTYALLLLPVGFMLLAMARFLRPPHPNAALVGFAAAAIFALYCHVTMLLMVAACSLAIASATIGRHRLIGLPDLGRWVIANIPVAVAAIPILMIVLSPVSNNGLTWIPPLSVHDILWAMEWTLTGPFTPTQAFGYEASFVLFVALGISYWLRPLARRPATVLGVMLVAFMLLITLASVRRSIIIPRILAWTWMPFGVLLAERLLAATKARRPLQAMTGIIFAVGLAYQLTPRPSGTDPWRDFVRLIEPDLKTTQMLVLAPYTGPTGMYYYDPGLGPSRYWDEHLPPTVENQIIPKLFPETPISRDDLIAAIRGGTHVLLILHPPDLKFLPTLLAAVPAPARRLDQTCGDAVCIMAIAW
jgi:4-amino-4-deoxy-L-arabinose transferase-like glycosyltransferase